MVDMREKFVRAAEGGLSANAVTSVVSIGISTAKRYTLRASAGQREARGSGTAPEQAPPVPAADRNALQARSIGGPLRHAPDGRCRLWAEGHRRA